MISFASLVSALVRRVERLEAHRVQTSSVLKMRSQKTEPRNQIENSTRPKWIQFGMDALLRTLSGATEAIL